MGSVNAEYSAVGILYFLRKSFMNSLDPSSCAAPFDGPKHLNPDSSNLSVMPLTKGFSGPMIVKSIFSLMANCANPSISSACISILMIEFSNSVPPFPGATKISFTKGLLDIFHERACSLPPDPTIKTFIYQCLKCLKPVNNMAIPASSAASITS